MLRAHHLLSAKLELIFATKFNHHSLQDADHQQTVTIFIATALWIVLNLPRTDLT